MDLVGLFKNAATYISKKGNRLEDAVNDMFKAKLKCGCFGYDCCIGYTQMASHKSDIKKGFYFDDAGDLYFGTYDQAKALREGEPNTGIKIN